MRVLAARGFGWFDVTGDDHARLSAKAMMHLLSLVSALFSVAVK